MCGIAGYIGRRPPDFDLERLIGRMAQTMAHRGPDDSGAGLYSWLDEGSNGGGGSSGDGAGGASSADAARARAHIALGHRRLSIIDLSERARQPMQDAGGRLSIAFNGEIYNYIELKDELRALGHAFTTTSDTEVILAAYGQWGTGCFARMNGMWGLAIVDLDARKVVLSRDRLGKKPLYYWAGDGELLFASEIKALFAHPRVPRAPDLDKVFRYISTNYRYVDVDEQSFFEGILQVPKATFVEVDADLRMKPTPYWRLSAETSRASVSDAEAIEGFRDLFVDSVRIRLRSDVPVGCMLSGGMDSTSITCAAYKVLGQPIVTFSGVTGDVKGVYDESDYIDSVVRATNANHHYIKPDPSDLFATVDEMLAYHDEPVCTVTWYSLYLLAKKIRSEGVPVILNGHGGDELLAGYWDHYHYHFWDLFRAGLHEQLECETEAWRENHGRDPAELDRVRDYIRCVDCGEAGEMSRFPDYSDVFLPEVAARWRREVRLPVAGDTWLSRRLYSEVTYETVPASLRPEDRNTMSQSLESRSPLLDYRLMEYCFSLPGPMKIRDGVGKWVLREAMKGILPEDVRTRKDKAGFIAPADEWFRTVNRDQMRALIESKSLASRGLFDVRRLREVFDEHLCGAKNHQMFLWQLMNLELWFRRFFDAAEVERAPASEPATDEEVAA